MLDGELEGLAAQAGELTDVARQALKDELSRRSLPWRLSERETPQSHGTAVSYDSDISLPFSSSCAHLDPNELCLIRRFLDFHVAILARSKLEAAGIPAFLPDEFIIGGNPHFSDALGGVRLLVRFEDLAEAERILDEPIPSDFEVDGVGKYTQPRCPNCFSLDVTFAELDNRVTTIVLAVGLPAPLVRNMWLCHSCGQRWEDDLEE